MWGGGRDFFEPAVALYGFFFRKELMNHFELRVPRNEWVIQIRTVFSTQRLTGVIFFY